MIAVIADDFTGAAEIGGIGLRHGLKVVIETRVEEACGCDLLIIATDTRSLLPELAAAEIKKITSQLLKLKPEFIYKKLDSVLRGNIEVELYAQMDVMQKQRAIVIAGNPQFDRLIKNGVYYIKGEQLAKTFFANDIEFPISTSNVVEIIKKSRGKVLSCKVTDELPQNGLIIGDVSCREDLIFWCEKIDNKTVIAGSSGFFDIIIKKYFSLKAEKKENKMKVGHKSLYVFGSMYPKSTGLIQQMNGSDVVQMNMPEKLFQSQFSNIELIERWATDINKNLETGTKVVVTVNHTPVKGNGTSVRVKENIGILIAKIFEKAPVDDLLIEGGATTSEILKNLNISKLYPFNEIDLGVIQMKVDNLPELCITTKPGSYTWPKDVWITNIVDKTEEIN